MKNINLEVLKAAEIAKKENGIFKIEFRYAIRPLIENDVNLVTYDKDLFSSKVNEAVEWFANEFWVEII